jgi:SWI/SNF-related matrix-associated actin-dependent regulator 1 of chromatin subfamily A
VILDFNPAKSVYFLRVPRADSALVRSLVTDYGLDFSQTASIGDEAVLFTHEAYAAVTFVASATERARTALGRLPDDLAQSWRADAPAVYWSPPDGELWPFQRASVAYALDRQHCLVADQPGLGKTPIAITVANERQAKHVLVVCPANIRRQWERRIRQWSRAAVDFGRDCIVHAITSGRRGVAPVADYARTWNIVSYDLARTAGVGAALARQHYDLVILDEAHYLKTVDSKRTRALFGGGESRKFDAICDRTDSVLALTGTPLPNRPREAYTLARRLCWDAIDWASEEAFSERFNPSQLITGQRADGSSYQFIDERTGRTAELQNRLRANFMVRHLKREVMPQLQMPVYDLIRVDETKAVKAALEAERLLDIDPDDLTGADMQILGHVAAVRRQMGVAIAPQISDYVQMLLDGGDEKLVIFAWHIEVLDILERGLRKNGTVRIDGRTSPAAKDRLVRQFVADPGIQVALGNIQAMGTGTDGLQEVATHGLIAEPSWTPGENIQCGDRLDRGGQKGRVQLDIFVAPNSIAERVLASSLRKLAVTDAALDKRL